MTTKYITSPYPVSNKRHPAQEEIDKCLGSYNLNVTFTEDVDTMAIFKYRQGIIAVLCTVRKNNRIIGVGRAHSALDAKMTKYVARTVFSVFNASLIDAVSKSTRIIDTLHTDSPSPSQANVEAIDSNAYDSDMITERQKKYLLELINSSNEDDAEKERMSASLDVFTRQEASEAIQSFKD